MKIIKLNKIRKFVAGDSTVLKEILHPAKVKLKIKYSLACAALGPGRKSLPHKLETSEVYYILEGRGRMHVGKKTSSVGAGTAIYIPPNSVQYIENTGTSDLKFLCIVDPAWRAEDETILKPKRR